MSQPAVSVVIVTWNRKEEVLESIRSVYDQACADFEVIVVDNGSNDGTCAAVREAYPDVRLIELDRNLGPTGGRNAGFRVAHAEVVFCLDSDASLGRDTLATVVRRFAQDPRLGVINSRIVNAYTGEPDPNAGWAYSEKQRAHSGEEFYTHNFSEAGCAIRRTVLEKVGPFWERLFFGGEGEELGIRVLDAGFRILYLPQSIIYHRAPSGKMRPDPSRRYYNLRNSLFIYLVHYPWWMLIWFVPLKIAACTIQGLRQGSARWVLAALRDTARELPALWKERRPIRNETARVYLHFQREHGALSWSVTSWLANKA
mgnify:CR=1 FL=1